MRCLVEQLGRVEYAAALELQRERIVQRKAREIPDTLLLLEHPHVYTLGRNARGENLLVSRERLLSLGAEVFETDRGGDVTYHGPGQLVGYPILDLSQHRRDISWYMRSLEEVFIRVAHDFRIRAHRLEGCPGVWVGDEKLVAMGVHILDNCDLEELSKSTAERKRWDFLLTTAPMAVPGATGSSLNPIAVF